MCDIGDADKHVTSSKKKQLLDRSSWYNILHIRTLLLHYYKVSYICSYSYVWGAIIRCLISVAIVTCGVLLLTQKVAKWC